MGVTGALDLNPDTQKGIRGGSKNRCMPRIKSNIKQE